MKKTATTLLIAVSIAAAPLRASAAIPVVDVENIAQQLKTYLETVKLVTNTAEQIQMQLLELKSLPERLITKYKNELLASVNKAIDHAKKTGVLVDEAEWKKTLERALPCHSFRRTRTNGKVGTQRRIYDASLAVLAESEGCYRLSQSYEGTPGITETAARAARTQQIAGRGKASRTDRK